MSASRRRRRGLVLLSLALASGGLAASHVRQRVESVEARVGPLVPVVVAARDLRGDAELRRGDLSVRRVPERFAPRDSLASRESAAGLRTAVPVPAGAYLTATHLHGTGERGEGGGLRRGERALEVAVVGGEALSGAASPGSRVDVVVSTDGRDGGGRTFLALEAVELLALRPGSGEPPPNDDGAAGAAATASAVATLRVSVRQAVYLTAAHNFAREVRLLFRPPGDRARQRRTAITAGEL